MPATVKRSFKPPSEEDQSGSMNLPTSVTERVKKKRLVETNSMNLDG
ncbi:MAG: hypothetical protein ABSA81_03700 [Candidatus Bathyarchaeia archaeon]|jgi:hypothetical protein